MGHYVNDVRWEVVKDAPEVAPEEHAGHAESATTTSFPRIEKAIGIACYLEGYGKGLQDQKVVECALDIIEALQNKEPYVTARGDKHGD